jgi:flavin-binding protein dodecin
MPDHVYLVSELVGTSPDGVDAAIRSAIERAATDVEHLDWFEVTEIRGHIQNGSVAHFQVSMKVGSRMADS